MPRHAAQLIAGYRVSSERLRLGLKVSHDPLDRAAMLSLCRAVGNGLGALRYISPPELHPQIAEVVRALDRVKASLNAS